MPADDYTNLFRDDVLDPNEPCIGLVRVVNHALVKVRRLMFAEMVRLDMSGTIVTEGTIQTRRQRGVRATLALTCMRGKRRGAGEWRSQARNSSSRRLRYGRRRFDKLPASSRG